MAISSVELCSSALVKLGAQAISSFQDGTVEAEVSSRLYPLMRDVLLCAHPWSFATAQANLVRLSDEPISGFAHAYALPQDLLKVLSAGDTRRPRGIEYQIVRRQLHTDRESVVLNYICRPSEGDFPAYFSNALVSRLAAELCLPLTENSVRAERLSRVAEEELKLAKLVDSQQDTPPRLEHFSLIEARGA